jgi:hypothetical protein
MCAVEESLDNLWLATEGLLTTCFNQHCHAYEVIPFTEDNVVLLNQHHLPMVSHFILIILNKMDM